ncbi:MAG: hypothetical protein CBC09_09800 [Cellvibrionales bacterium TMED49]|nr:MAG: hypothetical protein CBC09_09800 [Cellvibrionales bacterium TMED49]
MAFFQVTSPDIAGLSLGGATLRLLESHGFTSDEKYLLVRATYTDDADTSYGLNYGYFVYDLLNREYVSTLNALVGGVNSARDFDVTRAEIIGSSNDWSCVALVSNKGIEGSRLMMLRSDQTVLDDLLAIHTELRDVAIENFKIDRSGRFLAIQTSNPQLALDSQPDTNDSSDIYLLDLNTSAVIRVSYPGGGEVNEPAYLKSIFVANNEVRIAFVSDAAFVSPSKIDTNSSNISAESGYRSDAYVWSARIHQSGTLGGITYHLQSVDIDGTAAGFVSRSDYFGLANSGAFFSSTSEIISDDDTNGSKDVFVRSEAGEITRLVIPSLGEMSDGAQFLSASDSGNHVALLSFSEEVAGSSGAQQLVVLDMQSGEYKIASASMAGALANNWVTSGTLSPSGYSVAFTTSANNLTPEAAIASSGSLFVDMADLLPISGRVYHWASHALLGGVQLDVVEATGGGEDVGELLATAVSDSGGQYSLVSKAVGDAVISATRDLALQDMSRVVTSADALAALKIAVGINPNPNEIYPTSPYQYIAADVNKDGRVTSADALSTLKIAVGLSESIPQEWLLVPEIEDFWDETLEEYTLSKSFIEWYSGGLPFTSPELSEANFVAILLGDVNGSWEPPAGASVLNIEYFIALQTAGLASIEQWGVFPSV